jgi:hypothetical protein
MGRAIVKRPKSAYERLSIKQRAFVDNYIACNFNATAAARMTGYAQPHSQGPRLLDNVGIGAAVSERISNTAMSANEVIRRYANYAQFDVSEFIRVPQQAATSLEDDEVEVYDKARVPYPYVDLEALIAAGYGYAIKSVKVTQQGPYIEFHDPMSALQTLAKAHGLLSEKIALELTGRDGGPIELTAVPYAEDELSEWRQKQRRHLTGTAKVLNG